jgi:hypothetical protein
MLTSLQALSSCWDRPPTRRSTCEVRDTREQFLNCNQILGFIEALISIFGVSNEETWATLPEGPTWQFAYASTLLLLCTAVCLVGSKLFSRATSAIACVNSLLTLLSRI